MLRCPIIPHSSHLVTASLSADWVYEADKDIKTLKWSIQFQQSIFLKYVICILFSTEMELGPKEKVTWDLLFSLWSNTWYMIIYAKKFPWGQHNQKIKQKKTADWCQNVRAANFAFSESWTLTSICITYTLITINCKAVKCLYEVLP